MFKKLKFYFQKFFLVAGKALCKTVNDDGIEHAGYMSFMVLLAIFPFIVFIFAFTGYIGDMTIGRIVAKKIISGLPPDAVLGFKSTIDEILDLPPQSIMTIAVLGSIWTASSFLEGLRTILNRVHEVSAPPNYLWRRFLSIMQFFVLSFILIILVLFLIFFPGFLGRNTYLIQLILPNSPAFVIFKYLFIFTSLLFIVSLLYYIIPNREHLFISVLPGSFITVLSWSVSGKILNFYILSFSKFNLIYGNLAKIIISLLFFFVANMIFIYGAAFNHLWRVNSKKII